ncbi:MAG: glycosyltransferase family 9 protein [Gammaproteobacteria bacterium]
MGRSTEPSGTLGAQVGAQGGAPPRALFVPVSGPSGMGEFARARGLADALKARWPELETHFLVHRDAPYARGFHHPLTLLPASPTLCTAEVAAAIRAFRPGVVVFDNAGRSGALHAARAAGAHAVYVSSRSRQHYKAFRLRWMRLLDDHWISYPAPIAGPLTTLERLKLRLMGRPAIRFLDAAIAPPDAAAADALLSGGASPEVIIVPGGGSQFHDSAMTPARFARWGEALAARGHEVVFVAGPSFTAEIAPSPRLRVLRGVGGGALMALLMRSRMVLVNGGDTLLQTIVLGKPCVAVPIAGDQAARIAACTALGAAAAPKPDDVVATCAALLGDTARLDALAAAARGAGFTDALPGMVARLGAHLGLT